MRNKQEIRNMTFIQVVNFVAEKIADRIIAGDDYMTAKRIELDDLLVHETAQALEGTQKLYPNVQFRLSKKGGLVDYTATNGTVGGSMNQLRDEYLATGNTPKNREDLAESIREMSYKYEDSCWRGNDCIVRDLARYFKRLKKEAS